MANLLDQFLSDKGKQQLEYIVGALGIAQKTIDEINKNGLKLEADIKGAATLKEYVTLSKELRMQNADLMKQSAILQKHEEQVSKQRQAIFEKERAELEKQTRAEEKAAAARIKAEQDKERATTKAEKARQRELKNSAREAANLETVEKNLEKQMLKEAEAAFKLNNAYEQLKVIVRMNTEEGMRLAAQHGLTSKEFLNHEAATKRYRVELESIHRAMGNHRDNVGNYSSALFSMTQVMRELPSAANGFPIFLQAIGNNLPQLRDEFARVKKEVGSTGAAMKIFATGLFSASNIFTLVVAALTIGVTLFSRWGREAKEATKANDAFNDSQKELAKNIGDEVGKMRGLIEVAKNATLSYKDRGDAVDQLQRLYPEYFGNMNREKILNGEVAETYEQVTKAIIRRARVTAQQQLLNKAVADEVEAQIALDEMTIQTAGKFNYYSEQDIKSKKAQIKLAQDRQKTIVASMNAEAQAATESFGWIDTQQKKEWDALQAKLKANALLTEDERKELKKRAEDAEKQRMNAARQAKEHLEDVAAYFKNLDGLGTANTSKPLPISEQIANLNGLVKTATDNFKKLEKQSEESLEAMARAMAGPTQSWEEYQKKTEQVYNTLQDFAFAYSEVGQLVSVIDGNRMMRLDEEQKSSDLWRQKEIDRINVTMTAGIEKEQALAEVESKHDGDRQQREEERKKAAIRNAVFEKSATIMQISLATYLSIMRALSDKELPYPLRVANSIAAGVAGGAQIAAAAATQLPQYYTGVDSSPETWAKVGERGKELRINPDGTMEVTPNQETITYLQKGTKIIPHEKTMDILNAVQLGSMSGYLSHVESGKKEKILAEALERTSERSTDRLVRSNNRILEAINRQGSGQSFSFSQMYGGYYDKKKN